MVSKGAGYAIESIIAVATVFIFIFGTFQVPEGQNWNQFRTQVSANDLTYALQKSGYLNHALSEGEVGSVQTAFASVSERNFEVSGLVSNLPINENRIGFYTKPSRRYTQNLGPPDPAKCGGDLEEISTRSEEPVLRTEGGPLQTLYPDIRLYVGDLDPNQVGGNSKEDYDSVWVDNGTDCQFSNAEGPYYVDNFIKWGPDNYDVEWIDGGSREIRLFNSTQTVRFERMLNRPVNSVDTFTSVDSVNFTEVGKQDYNILVVRSKSSVDSLAGANQTIVENHLNSGSMLVLADFSQNNFQPGDFMRKAGFKYVGVPYEGAYSGGPVSGEFTSGSESQNTKTYFEGLSGNENSISLASPRIFSNREDTIETSNTILLSSKEYNLSKWNREKNATSPMTPINPATVTGEPQSQCYPLTPSALTTASKNFPDGNSYSFINAELGTSSSYCSSNNTRAVKVDLTGPGVEYSDPGEGPFLNNGKVQIADRQYAVRIIFNQTSSTCGEGECVEFVFTGDRQVELVAHRSSLRDFSGGRIAAASFERLYEEDDRKLLTSTLHWLRGDQLAFTGRRNPEDISTDTYSGISNRTYMPYEVNLRWSR